MAKTKRMYETDKQIWETNRGTTKTGPGVNDAWMVKPDKAAMACQFSVSLTLVSDFQPTKKRGLTMIFSPTSSRLYIQDWSGHTSHNSITPKDKARDQELGAGVDDIMKPYL